MNKENVLVRIYELRDPRDVECKPRYVGITSKSLKYRLTSHKNNITDDYRGRWFKKLAREGVKLTIHLIEEIIGWNYACEVEKYWIREFKEQGYKLTNSTLGGEGFLGGTHTPEVCEKLRIINIGKKIPQETINKILESRKGYTPSEETRRKISIANKGRIISEEMRKQISNTLKGNIIPQEVRDKISKAHLGKPKQRWAVEKSIQGLLGHSVSQETRDKIIQTSSEPIILIYTNDTTEEFKSLKECSSIKNVAPSSLRRWILSGWSKKLNCVVKYKNKDLPSYNTLSPNSRKLKKYNASIN